VGHRCTVGSGLPPKTRRRPRRTQRTVEEVTRGMDGRRCEEWRPVCSRRFG
jgi:hypothetical protein